MKKIAIRKEQKMNKEKLVNVTILRSHVDKTELYEGKDTEKYSIKVIVDKEDFYNLKAIEEATKQAYTKYKNLFQLDGKQIPYEEIKKPLCTYDDENFSESYCVTMRTKFKPQVVDKYGNQINPNQIFPGNIVNVSCTFYGYRYENNMGIAISLGNLMKVSEGNRTYSDALDDFADLIVKDDEETEEYNEIEIYEDYEDDDFLN